jgi:cell division protein FtsI (penicillin-binding protein 3)
VIKARQLAEQPRSGQGSTFRLLLVWAILIAGQLGLVVRLFYLQVREAPALREKARQQQLVPLPRQIALRPIVDRNGNVLAVDQPVFTLFAHPYLFKETKEVVAEKLAPILQRSASDLIRLLGTAESGIPVAYELSEDTSDKIRNLEFDGLELIQQWQRIYPQRELTSGIVGYVDAEHQGQAGIEYGQQKLLKPIDSHWKLSEDGAGFLLPDRFPLGSVNTDDLTLRLTVDTRLQRAARTALRQKLQQYQALRGTVIVMNIRDGSLLALASEPSFDPKHYYKSDPGLFKNWAVSDLYEPGSTFKPINVAIALETGAVQQNSIFNDEGRIFVGGWPIQDNDYSGTGGRGPLSVTQILQYSSNVGMVHIMQQVKPSVYYSYLKRLGLGETVGTDLPFETAGQFKAKDQFVSYPIEPATTAFGQGFSVTPMQMVQLHAAIANGGKLVTPHVVQGLYDESGKKVKAPALPAPKQVLSPAITQKVLTMMGNVVANGTGKPAQIPGYRSAGKTGTAQKAIGGTYSSSRITSFVDLFPLESPRYVVLAVVDEPKGDDAFGSTVAAPVVKSVLEALITLEGIPPSHPTELQKASQEER